MNCFACVPLVKEESFASFPYQPVGTNALGLEAVHFGSRSSLLAFTLSRIILVVTNDHDDVVIATGDVAACAVGAELDLEAKEPM